MFLRFCASAGPSCAEFLPRCAWFFYPGRHVTGLGHTSAVIGERPVNAMTKHKIRDLEVTFIPEPATAALLATGLVTLTLRRRRADQSPGM